MINVLTSTGGESMTIQTVATIGHAKMEVGAHINRFHVRPTKASQRKICNMGNYGSTDKIHTLSAHQKGYTTGQTCKSIREVILHGILMTIVSNRDTEFVSKLWNNLHQTLGAILNFNTTFHPQTNGQSERTIHISEDVLRSRVMDFEGLQDDHFLLAEFTYNNKYQASIQMAPFETLCGRKCISPSYWMM